MKQISENTSTFSKLITKPLNHSPLVSFRSRSPKSCTWVDLAARLDLPQSRHRPSKCRSRAVLLTPECNHSAHKVRTKSLRLACQQRGLPRAAHRPERWKDKQQTSKSNGYFKLSSISATTMATPNTIQLARFVPMTTKIRAKMAWRLAQRRRTSFRWATPSSSNWPTVSKLSP